MRCTTSRSNNHLLTSRFAWHQRSPCLSAAGKRLIHCSAARLTTSSRCRPSGPTNCPPLAVKAQQRPNPDRARLLGVPVRRSSSMASASLNGLRHPTHLSVLGVLWRPSPPRDDASQGRKGRSTATSSESGCSMIGMTSTSARQEVEQRSLAASDKTEAERPERQIHDADGPVADTDGFLTPSFIAPSRPVSSRLPSLRLRRRRSACLC